MQLRHLRYFVATADAGSVSAAAVRVHVTQPALSRQLRQLEQDLGVALFDRSAGRLVLSRTGQALLPAARELLASAHALEARATFHARGSLERVTIAAPTVTLTDVVSPFVATMSKDDPVVDVRSADGLSPAEMLHDGADLAIGTQRLDPPYAMHELAVLPVWAYVRATDPWANRTRVALDELLQRPLVVLPSTFTAREALDSAVFALGGSYSAVVEAANGTIAQALAASGRGVAVVTDDSRFDLSPLSIELSAGVLEIRLTAAWDPRGVAAATIADLARRLGLWVQTAY
ncbi:MULTISPECIES: LysR family transcriptional regulator [unclassified Nocardioides]|uniref:LysR family transcriptional regulator n=1 Tax=unclassified Nocardioides TaxID=2615069 RepID=UPI00005718CE|nr:MULTISPECIES: LysR family transcriptional regulator [unclassified Nocardioides]ABL80170.1 regulatory protein, LysR [Nocardioides sp. JS614]